MVVCRLPCSSQWEPEVWKQNFICVLCSVSAVREVKHRHHNHLCLLLDSARGMNHNVLVLGFFLFLVVVFLFILFYLFFFFKFKPVMPPDDLRGRYYV